MKIPENLCLGCMKHMSSDNGICEHCGFNLKEYNANPRWLKPGTVIGGKYIVGKVLGEGGFGITYIGWNSLIEMPVAIKEYFPQSASARDHTTTKLSVFMSEKELFEDGMRKLLNEARTMSRMETCSGIVSIYDYFNENNTAYIIMEYVDGSSMKEYIKANGPMPVDQVLSIARPIMEDLERMHSLNLIHRDVSPDNIMIRNDGQIKLIDFGAARLVEQDEEKSFTVMLKRGYTPEEQYRSKGEQGPWTDVYALCATLYYMITGENIPEAMQRVISDTYTSIRDAGFSIDEKTAAAIDKGLAVKYTDRIQSMSELIEMLYGEGNGASAKQNNKMKKAVIAGVVLAMVSLVGIILILRLNDRKNDSGLAEIEVTAAPIATSAPTKVPATTPTPAPVATPEASPEATQESQATPDPASVFATVPKVAGKSISSAKKKLKKAQLEYSITKEYDNTVKKGYVITQNIDKGTQVAPGTVIRLTVSKGKAPATPTPKPYSGQTSKQPTAKPKSTPKGTGEKGPADNVKAIDDNDNDDDELTPVTGL